MKGNDTVHTLFSYNLEQLLVFGRVELSHSAIASLFRNEVDTVFLSQNGRYIGRLGHVDSKNVFLRRKQFRLLEDTEFALRVAKAIVLGKISNQATLLKRIKRSKQERDPGILADQITAMRPRIFECENLDALRGYEGRAAALFFDGFKYGLKGSWGFQKRIRRPPTDPVNSVLSLLYTFLMNRVYPAVRIAGLDPCVGGLHCLDYGRYSLVLDLMEEFRSIIADTLTLSIFNLGILKENDFQAVAPAEPKEPAVKQEGMADVAADPIGWISTPDISSEIFDLPEQAVEASAVCAEAGEGKLPIVLVPDAMGKVIDAFERKLETKFFYGPGQREITYAQALIEQALQYRKVVDGEISDYQPLLLR